MYGIFTIIMIMGTSRPYRNGRRLGIAILGRKSLASAWTVKFAFVVEVIGMVIGKSYMKNRIFRIFQ